MSPIIKTKQKVLEFMVVCASSGALLWINRLLMTKTPRLTGDMQRYLKVAQWDFNVDSVIAYRVLMPFFVRITHLIIGVSERVGYDIVTTLSLFATLVLFYYFLRNELKFSRLYCAIGLFFLAECGESMPKFDEEVICPRCCIGCRLREQHLVSDAQTYFGNSQEIVTFWGLGNG